MTSILQRNWGPESLFFLKHCSHPPLLTSLPCPHFIKMQWSTAANSTFGALCDSAPNYLSRAFPNYSPSYTLKFPKLTFSLFLMYLSYLSLLMTLLTEFLLMKMPFLLPHILQFQLCPSLKVQVKCFVFHRPSVSLQTPWNGSSFNTCQPQCWVGGFRAELHAVLTCDTFPFS